MKKILLSIVLGMATTITFGQIEAGTKILGGTFSFYSNNDKTENNGATVETPSSSFSIIPSFGYMFKDNMGAGIRLGIDNSSSGKDSLKVENSMTIVGLFGRYYLEVAGDALFFHTDLVLDLGFGSTKQGGSTSDRNTMEVGLRPGWDYFIGDKWAIEMNWGMLGYSSVTNENSDAKWKNTVTSFGLSIDYSTFGLGARYYF